MNWKHWLPVLALITGTIEGSYAENLTEKKSGIDLQNLDQKVQPGTNFYQFACGGWSKNHPLTPEYSRYGSFEELIENNNKKLRQLVEDLAAQKHQAGSLEDKIATLYRCAMDSTTQNKEGWQPIRTMLEQIDRCSSKEELMETMAEMEKNGVPGLYQFYIGADIKNSTQNLLQVYQGGITLGEKEYYLDTDTATTAIREAYKKYIREMASYCGRAAAAEQMVKDVMRLETRIAKSSYSATEQRDPEANYHKMSYEQLLADYPGINWNKYFNILGIRDIKEISVSQPEPIHEVEKIWKEESLEALKAFASWKLMDAAAPYLDDKIRDIHFAFYGKALSGMEAQKPRWKRSLAMVDEALGEALGQIYVAKYFPAEAKERMKKLIHNLQIALGERIKEQDWMSEATRRVALEKLDAFKVKVGYPDKWKDYSNLQIGHSLWENYKNCVRFELATMIREKMNRPVDQEEWHMTPQTVNAYYNPTTNEICFPAGILQYPFFDMNYDDAFNYGAIGVVIGHEMTHGFDDQGRQFDKNGNLTDWWAPGDAERFEERTRVMENFFNNIEVLPGLKANGKLTLGENLADHGGLNVAFLAFQHATKGQKPVNKEGFTPEQRFFLSYGNVWAENIRDEEIRKRTKSDPHALGYWRVNGALPHIDAWYQAFGITEKDPMFLPADKRVRIW